MYDEYERAVGGGGSGRGRSPVLWFGLVLGFFLLTGALAVGFAVRKGIATVEEIAGDLDVRPARAAARLVERLERHTDLLRADPDEGLAFLRTLDATEPERGLLRTLDLPELPSSASTRATRDGATPQSAERMSDRAERTFTFRAGDQDLRIDLDRADDGGSLVIASGDETVRFDLLRTEDGGFLTIDTGAEQARIDLLRTDDGGSLAIDGPEGRVRFDLTETEDGGSLTMRTDGDEVLRLGMGSDAVAMPRWVPALPGMPRTPRPVYSLVGEDGFLGAVSWDDDAPVAEVVDFYVTRLEDDGYRLEGEGHDRGGRAERSALWARHPDSGRVVFLLATEDDGTTRVLLGYGERE